MKITKTDYIVSQKSENKPEDVNTLLSSYPYYQIIGDERACKTCSAHDREIIPVTQAKEGVTVPPFHPNCRCATIGCYYDKKTGPPGQESKVWDYLEATRLTDEKIVQLLRKFYSLSRPEYTDQEVLIHYVVSLLHSANRQEAITGFINRIDPRWTKPIGKNDDDVIFDRENNPGFYESNSEMDYDGDNRITRRDIAEHMNKQLEDFWENWVS